QIRTADGRRLDGDDDAFGPWKHGVGDVAQADVARSLQNGCSHSPHARAGLDCHGPNFRAHPSFAVMTSPSQPSTTIELDVLADEDVDAFFAFEDLWAVVVWNDDVTTFQTVIQALVEILGHTVERADQLAWKIH